MNKEENSKIILYTDPDGQIKIDVRFQGETVWLSQQLMGELFQTTKQNISLHIKNIFEEGELSENSVVKDFLTTAADEKSYHTKFYNLDMIIAVGYRIKSRIATNFRQWATKVLREYMIKGFALDDERLKYGKSLRRSYFDELLERIRDIRASERLFYQKITDIYAQCSADYDPESNITQEFYATVQNKLHWAIHGHTAAELIAKRTDALKPYMGLTTWRNAPKGRIRKADVSIAKNYLNETELKQLNRIVTMYLDYAEMQAENQRTMTMKEWVAKLDAFLRFNERDVLTNPGKVSAEVAKELAEKEFEKYEENLRQIEATQPISDFDKLVEKTKLLVKKESKKRKK
ncbi:MAG: virulence RhuM family protein [Firmicutes bacterium]|nr:virulence RhuM family protein [Bacillota bacterium]